MTVSDPWGMPISCTAEVAPTYGAAMRRYHDRRSGDVELLQQVVAEDPGFAVGRATAALWAAFMDAPFDAQAEVEAARAGQAASTSGSGASSPPSPRRSSTAAGRRCRRGWPTTTPTPAT